MSLVRVGQNAQSKCVIQDYTNHAEISALPEGLVASVETAANKKNTVLCPYQIHGTCARGWRRNGRLLINVVKLFT